MKKSKIKCKHDYKNAIQVGKVDYICPLCRKLLNPMEWFFMNSFNFIDVETEDRNVRKDEELKEMRKRKSKKKQEGRL